MRAIFIFLLLSTNVAIAQQINNIKVKCLNLIYEDTTILYTGIDNYIKIVYSNPNDTDYTISIIGGIIKKQKNHYVINVKDPNRVTLLLKNNNSELPKTEKIFFFIKPFQPLIPMLCNTIGGHIKRNELLKEEKITLNYSKVEYLKKQFSIFGFKLVYTDNNGNTKELKSNSEALTNEQKEAIESLLPGQKFYIENVEIHDSYGNKIPSENVAFIVDVE
ncbi:MAG: hypothetical protein GYA62_10625 [Bacteroidales bacterium]|jgi:hypothetical protein|nr:hypothetical protein [Bacteroidales bacterium]